MFHSAIFPVDLFAFLTMSVAKILLHQANFIQVTTELQSVAQVLTLSIERIKGLFIFLWG